MKKVKHILISRTDNIGDVVLTLPMASFLKQYYPEVKVTFLVRDYTVNVVRLHPDVDGVMSWDQLSAMPKKAAIQFLKKAQIDCVIHVYPKSKVAKLMCDAGIKYRVGTYRRVHHWLYCNQWAYFSRAKSKMHEAVLNLKLLKPLGIEDLPTLDYLKENFHLKTNIAISDKLKAYLHPEKFNLILHPFTNGHTREWPVSQFNALIRQLPKEKFNILITGSEKEAQNIKQRIAAQFPDVVNLAGKLTLFELMRLIENADGLIANGTGPMHLAAAFGIRTLGLFPSEKNVDPTRWAPVGKKAQWLMVDPNCQAPRCKAFPHCLCMESITVDQVKSVVMEWC